MKRKLRPVALFVALCLASSSSLARYYDPETGTFLSRDEMEGSLVDAPSLHRYQYVRGNPLRYVDPTGHGLLCSEALDPATKAACEGVVVEGTSTATGTATAAPVGSTAVLAPAGPGSIIVSDAAAAATASTAAATLPAWKVALLSLGAVFGIGPLAAGPGYSAIGDDEVDRTIARAAPEACAGGNGDACGALAALERRRPDLFGDLDPRNGAKLVREDPKGPGTSPKSLPPARQPSAPQAPVDAPATPAETIRDPSAGPDQRMELAPRHRRDPSEASADAERVREQRERRRERRERESREGPDGAKDQAGNPQKPSGEGYRDHEEANKGPSGERPAGPDRSDNRERNVGIDEEHSRQPKGQSRLPQR